jgi:AcrR family transcriptional regulator
MDATPEPIPAPAPLRERQRALVREAIVTAAYELFEHRPYADVTVADIADAAVVSRATFFRHFADKQEVVFARQPDIRDTVSARELDRPCPVPATLRTALTQLRDIVVDVYREAGDSPWHLAHERLIDDNPWPYCSSIAAPSATSQWLPRTPPWRAAWPPARCARRTRRWPTP